MCTSGFFTFGEVQLLFVVVFLLRVVVRALVLRRHPLDLAGRLLPLPALVQRLGGHVVDEVIRLCLGQDGGVLTLEEQLHTHTHTVALKPNFTITTQRTTPPC